MPGSVSRYIITFFIFFFLSSSCYAQNREPTSSSGFNVSLKMGASQLIAEMPNDMSGTINEFNNHPGISYSFELSKNLMENLTVGIELSNSTLKGENDSPAFSAIGFHTVMMDPINEPVFYRNMINTNKVFIQYSFSKFSIGKSKHPLIPFVRAGTGYLTYKSEFSYKQNSENGIIFGKNYENFKTAKTSNAVYFFGTGFIVPLSPKISVSTLLNFNAVNYDFLDVVHNYNSDGSRLELLGIYSDLMIGISYRFCKIEEAGRSRLTGKYKKSAPAKYLPWYKSEK
jgi:hypothetical protein